MVFDANGEEYKREQHSAIFLLVLLLVTAMAVSLGLYLANAKKEPAKTDTSIPAGGTITFGIGRASTPYGDDVAPKVPAKVTRKELAAFASAMTAWTVALGGQMSLTSRPALEHGGCLSMSGSAIACADIQHNKILISEAKSDGYGYDLRTVLMHEIGHLLGVPHIEGDRLMDSVYSGKVDEPTTMAIAIAKEMQK